MTVKIKWAMPGRLLLWVATRDYQSVGDDIRKLGYDAVRTGVATVVINLWLDKALLSGAGWTLVAIGAIVYIVALPSEEPDD